MKEVLVTEAKCLTADTPEGRGHVAERVREAVVVKPGDVSAELAMDTCVVCAHCLLPDCAGGRQA
jgi:hypothetical protein